MWLSTLIILCLGSGLVPFGFADLPSWNPFKGYKRYCADNESGTMKCIIGQPMSFFICNNPQAPVVQQLAAGAGPCKGPLVLPESLFLAGTQSPVTMTKAVAPPTTTSPAPPPPATTTQRDCGENRSNDFGCVGQDVGPYGGLLSPVSSNCDLLRNGGPDFWPTDGELVCAPGSSSSYYLCLYGRKGPIYDFDEWNKNEKKNKRKQKKCKADYDQTGWGAKIVDK